jgi:hypothetical protein
MRYVTVRLTEQQCMEFEDSKPRTFARGWRARIKRLENKIILAQLHFTK